MKNYRFTLTMDFKDECTKKDFEDIFDEVAAQIKLKLENEDTKLQGMNYYWGLEIW